MAPQCSDYNDDLTPGKTSKFNGNEKFSSVKNSKYSTILGFLDLLFDNKEIRTKYKKALVQYHMFLFYEIYEIVYVISINYIVRPGR